MASQWQEGCPSFTSDSLLAWLADSWSVLERQMHPSEDNRAILVGTYNGVCQLATIVVLQRVAKHLMHHGF
jgi:hypothetical protein